MRQCRRCLIHISLSMTCTGVYRVAGVLCSEIALRCLRSYIHTQPTPRRTHTPVTRQQWRYKLATQWMVPENHLRTRDTTSSGSSQVPAYVESALCGRPISRNTCLARPSVCLCVCSSVPCRLLTKRHRRTKIVMKRSHFKDQGQWTSVTSRLTYLVYTSCV